MSKMLNIKDLLKNKDNYISLLKRRGFNASPLIKKVETLTKKIKDIDSETIPFLEERNIISKNIGLLKKNKKEKELKESLKRANEISINLNSISESKTEIQKEIKEIMLLIPNVPRETIPIGKDENDNVEIKKYLSNKIIKGTKSHYDIAEEKKIIDFNRGRKVAGSRFNYVIGKGAELYQALITWMIEKQRSNGFEQMFPPIMVNSEAMIGTGQLPKFADDQYKIEGEDKWLIPTAEVSLTNYFSNELLKEEDLNKFLFSLTPCFRKEAGSAGKDNKGIIRMHQFMKLELVKIINPKDDEKEFEHLLEAARSILVDLELPHRILNLCTGDIGNSANRTYDIEVWMPSENRYREISSISSFGDYQARRMKTRYKNLKTNKNEMVFTQNASGLAIDRTFAAILETYQDKDGNITIPKVLKKYVSFDKI